MDEVWQGASVAVPIIATVLSGLFAVRAHKSSQAADELRRREERLAEHKAKAYNELLGTFARMFDKVGKKPSQSEIIAALQKATHEFPMFASDQVLLGLERFMQATYNNAPTLVFMRLYADLLVAVRRDLGYPSTSLTAANVIGLRVTDLYTDGGMAESLTKDFATLCKEQGWEPPWERVAK